MNVRPITLRLSSGSVRPARTEKKRSGRLHVDEVHGELLQEGRLHLLALAGTHEAGVDEHGRQLSPIASCTSAAATAESTPPDRAHRARPRPDLVTDRLHAGGDDRGGRPGRSAPAHVEQEPLEQLLAPGGVHDLGVELDPVEGPAGVLEGCDGDLSRRRGDH